MNQIVQPLQMTESKKFLFIIFLFFYYLFIFLFIYLYIYIYIYKQMYSNFLEYFIDNVNTHDVVEDVNLENHIFFRKYKYIFINIFFIILIFTLLYLIKNKIIY